MNYYNEFDPRAAAWLRELIERGMIPKGDVDERSIADVDANDIRGYTQCHFFAGIGGWSFALRLAGWPEDKPVWTGSCPCQPFSTAGKQRGTSDERDLWPVFADLICKCRPEYVFGEQVENAIGHGWLDRVYSDLEAQSYAVGAVVLGAHSVAAPRRTAVSVCIGAVNCWPTTSANNGTGAGTSGRLGGENLQTAVEKSAWGTPRVTTNLGIPCPDHTGNGCRIEDQAELSAWYTPKALDGNKRGNVAMNPQNGLAAEALIVAFHTPRATDGTNGGPNQANGALAPDADMAVWYTPKAGDGVFALPRTSGRPIEKSTHLTTQTVAVTAWPTALSRDWKDGTEANVPPNTLGSVVWQVFLRGQTSDSSTAGMGKSGGYRLNPYFSAWLMGFPKEWTAVGLAAYRKQAASRSPRKKKAAPCC